MYAIYGLRDPRDQKVFYVGQTTDVYKRFIDHISCSSNNIARNTKIIELRKLNLMVIMEGFEHVETQDKANESESYWIRHFEHLHQPLTNVALMSQPKRSRREQYKAAKSRMAQLMESADTAHDLPVDSDSVQIGVDLRTKSPVVITKEQFEMLVEMRKNGTLTGFRQIMSVFSVTEAHARNLNRILDTHLTVERRKYGYTDRHLYKDILLGWVCRLSVSIYPPYRCILQAFRSCNIKSMGRCSLLGDCNRNCNCYRCE